MNRIVLLLFHKIGKNKNGYCRLSVIASCQPKTITSLLPSPYSLDDKDKLPFVLKFNYK